MSWRERLAGRWRRTVMRHGVGAGLILILVYFGWHSIHGERGILAWIDENRRLEEKRAELEALLAERELLEARVDALRPERTDPDLLEEELLKLGFVKDDEVVILMPETETRTRP